MEIFVDDIATLNSLRRNKPSVNHDFEAAANSGAENSFRDELARRINELTFERSVLELQAQFAPVISTDRSSYVMASSAVNRLRVK